LGRIYMSLTHLINEPKFLFKFDSFIINEPNLSRAWVVYEQLYSFIALARFIWSLHFKVPYNNQCHSNLSWILGEVILVQSYTLAFLHEVTTLKTQANALAHGSQRLYHCSREWFLKHRIYEISTYTWT